MGTSSTVVKMGEKLKQVAGRKRDKEGHPKTCSNIHASDDFMKNRFLPLFTPKNNGIVKACEASLIQSLSFIGEKFQIEILNTEGKEFPYNILAAHWDIQGKLRRINGNLNLRIVKNTKTNDIHLATYESVDTGQTLYYIPIVPIYLMLKTKGKRKCGQLLLMICADLYRKAGIPMYTRNCCIQDYYESIEEYWYSLFDEGEEIDIEKMRSELRQTRVIGDIMSRKMENNYLIENYKDTTSKIKVNNLFEQKCLILAKEAHEICKTFPNNSIFQHITFNEDDYDDKGSPDTYISFVATTKGYLWEDLNRSINEELSNYAGVLEPEIINIFDKPFKGLFPSLDYERSIFRLIIKLSKLINEIEEWKI
ncbi:hypothetical protein GCM10027566_08790 [Arachidicoccus ginsenosidivorans]|uniref:Uncharacterized protein n=1 Tax=Arachidicoccus ginsenosidivorans TaxID=496057 RepID=A0A5B8VQC2_9BACT|nr:hypothetical protein [Arachidicoccus ginsenosidivorans]QEC73311.1 hypothetical protein FSB73_18190 [Arachidicoccus ginsenosidivorans]